MTRIYLDGVTLYGEGGDRFDAFVVAELCKENGFPATEEDAYECILAKRKGEA